MQRLAPHSAKTGPSARKNIGQKPVRGTANCDSADFLSVKLCTVAGFVLGATAAILLKTVLGVSTTAGHIWFGILGVLIGTSLGWTVGNVLQLAPDVRMAVIALVVGVSLIAAGVAPLMYPNFAEEAAQKKLRAAEEAVARRENRRQWEVPPPEAPVVVIDYGTHVVYDREGADRERRRQKGAQEVRRLRSNAQNALNELEIARAPRLVVVATVVGMLLLGVLATANGAFCLLNIRLRQRRTDRRNSRKWEVSERTSD